MKFREKIFKEQKCDFLFTCYTYTHMLMVNSVSAKIDETVSR